MTGPDGKIYTAGGYQSDGGVSDAFEAFDTTTQTWTVLPNLPTPRAGPVAAVGDDGVVYVIGGMQWTACCCGGTCGNVWLNTVEGFDPTTGAWGTGVSMPTARALLGAATGSDGRIYAVEGTSGIAGAICGVAYLAGTSAVEAYSASSFRWW